LRQLFTDALTQRRRIEKRATDRVQLIDIFASLVGIWIFKPSVRVGNLRTEMSARNVSNRRESKLKTHPRPTLDPCRSSTTDSSRRANGYSVTFMDTGIVNNCDERTMDPTGDLNSQQCLQTQTFTTTMQNKYEICKTFRWVKLRSKVHTVWRLL
jgi:hypothetical protein